MPLSIRCVNCNTVNELEPPIGRRDECEKCMGDLRTCKQCHFYDTSAANDCREPAAEPVREADRANFCDFFRPVVDRGEVAGPSKDELRAAAEALFKKK